MRNVLLPVDGSEHSDQAVSFFVDFTKEYGPVEAHLVNVEPLLDESQTRGLEQETIDAHLRALAHQSMRSAHQILEEAKLPHDVHIELGEPAEAIVALAKRLGCDIVLMATRGLGAVSSLMLGSVTHKVLHLSHIPVLCIKGSYPGKGNVAR